MAVMGSLIVEKNFRTVFDQFNVYFRDEILRRDWKFLLHTENSFYIPELVREFYANVSFSDVDIVMGNINVNWRGVPRFVNVNTLSEITGIPIAPGNQNPLQLEGYLFEMGPTCALTKDRGIRGQSMYRNVYTTCRWIQNNVLGTSHISSFYTSTLHIVHVLMHRDTNFCMNRQLLRTICDGKNRLNIHRNVTLPLPVLITRICQYFLTDAEFAQYDGARVLVRHETVTNAYRASVEANWTPSRLREDTAVTTSSDTPSAPTDEEDNAFFDQAPPADTHEFMTMIWKGMGKIWKKMSKKKARAGTPPITRSQSEAGRSTRGRHR